MDGHLERYQIGSPQDENPFLYREIDDIKCDAEKPDVSVEAGMSFKFGNPLYNSVDDQDTASSESNYDLVDIQQKTEPSHLDITTEEPGQNKAQMLQKKGHGGNELEWNNTGPFVIDNVFAMNRTSAELAVDQINSESHGHYFNLDHQYHQLPKSYETRRPANYISDGDAVFSPPIEAGQHCYRNQTDLVKVTSGPPVSNTVTLKETSMGNMNIADRKLGCNLNIDKESRNQMYFQQGQKIMHHSDRGSQSNDRSMYHSSSGDLVKVTRGPPVSNTVTLKETSMGNMNIADRKLSCKLNIDKESRNQMYFQQGQKIMHHSDRGSQSNDRSMYHSSSGEASTDHSKFASGRRRICPTYSAVPSATGTGSMSNNNLQNLRTRSGYRSSFEDANHSVSDRYGSTVNFRPMQRNTLPQVIDNPYYHQVKPAHNAGVVNYNSGIFQSDRFQPHFHSVTAERPLGMVRQEGSGASPYSWHRNTSSSLYGQHRTATRVPEMNEDFLGNGIEFQNQMLHEVNESKGHLSQCLEDNYKPLMINERYKSHPHDQLSDFDNVIESVVPLYNNNSDNRSQENVDIIDTVNSSSQNNQEEMVEDIFSIMEKDNVEHPEPLQYINNQMKNSCHLKVKEQMADISCCKYLENQGDNSADLTGRAVTFEPTSYYYCKNTSSNTHGGSPICLPVGGSCPDVQKPANKGKRMTTVLRRSPRTVANFLKAAETENMVVTDASSKRVQKLSEKGISKVMHRSPGKAQKGVVTGASSKMAKMVQKMSGKGKSKGIYRSPGIAQKGVVADASPRMVQKMSGKGISKVMHRSPGIAQKGIVTCASSKIVQKVSGKGMHKVMHRSPGIAQKGKRKGKVIVTNSSPGKVVKVAGFSKAPRAMNEGKTIEARISPILTQKGIAKRNAIMTSRAIGVIDEGTRQGKCKEHVEAAYTNCSATAQEGMLKGNGNCVFTNGTRLAKHDLGKGNLLKRMCGSSSRRVDHQETQLDRSYHPVQTERTVREYVTMATTVSPDTLQTELKGGSIQIGAADCSPETQNVVAESTHLVELSKDCSSAITITRVSKRRQRIVGNVRRSPRLVAKMLSKKQSDASSSSGSKHEVPGKRGRKSTRGRQRVGDTVPKVSSLTSVHDNKTIEEGNSASENTSQESSPNILALMKQKENYLTSDSVDTTPTLACSEYSSEMEENREIAEIRGNGSNQEVGFEKNTKYDKKLEKRQMFESSKTNDNVTLQDFIDDRPQNLHTEDTNLSRVSIEMVAEDCSSELPSRMAEGTHLVELTKDCSSAITITQAQKRRQRIVVNVRRSPRLVEKMLSEKQSDTSSASESKHKVPGKRGRPRLGDTVQKVSLGISVHDNKAMKQGNNVSEITNEKLSLNILALMKQKGNYLTSDSVDTTPTLFCSEYSSQAEDTTESITPTEGMEIPEKNGKTNEKFKPCKMPDAEVSKTSDGKIMEGFADEECENCDIEDINLTGESAMNTVNYSMNGHEIMGYNSKSRETSMKQKSKKSRWLRELTQLLDREPVTEELEDARMDQQMNNRVQGLRIRKRRPNDGNDSPKNWTKVLRKKSSPVQQSEGLYSDSTELYSPDLSTSANIASNDSSPKTPQRMDDHRHTKTACTSVTKKSSQEVLGDTINRLSDVNCNEATSPHKLDKNSRNNGFTNWKNMKMNSVQDKEQSEKEQVGSLGDLVWGKLGKSIYWPGIVVNGDLVGKARALQGKCWLFWFGDHKISLIPNTRLKSFTKDFSSCVSLLSKSSYIKAKMEAIKECQERAGLDMSSADDSFLQQWAQEGFLINGLSEPEAFRPSTGSEIPFAVSEKLQQIKNQCISLVSSDDTATDYSDDSQDSPLTKQYPAREKTITEVREGKANIEEICLRCGSRHVQHPHPMFKGGMCINCKLIIQDRMFTYGEDNNNAYCSICAGGKTLVLCDEEHCPRVFCTECIHLLVGEEEEVLGQSPWFCYLCNPESHPSQGLMERREDWRQRILHMYNPDGSLLSQVRVQPAKSPTGIRVLSLFDGIGTGCLVLSNLKIKVEKYYASEVDTDSMLVAQVRHGQSVLQLGDVTSITRKKLEEISPIDLLIGGPPCNDLSIVNPARRGLEGGSGVLFFEYARILSELKIINQDRHIFWMMENVASMASSAKEVISRYLGCEPAVYDAKNFSPQRRKRLFWGNIPGIYCPVKFANKNQDLQNVLMPSRQKKMDVVNCVTTNTNSLIQKRGLKPIRMADTADDVMWVPEIERLFGYPAHFTDVGNLSAQKRRSLLGRAWSVPVVEHLMKPLTQFFILEDEHQSCDSSSK